MDKRNCGIEVSARELVVAWTGNKGQAVLGKFANTAAGHRHLLSTVTRGCEQLRVCLEATGVYGLDLALFLSAQPQVEVMVANPRAVRHFAEAILQRSKTDALDAVLLWEFVQRMPFTAWKRPSENEWAWWALSRRLQALVKQQTAEKNRLHAATAAALPALVRRSMQRVLRTIEREKKVLHAEAARRIAAEPRTQRRYQLLRSMTGIGTVSAVTVLAELMLLPDNRSVRQWVAFAGLDPRQYSSGTSVRKHTRISRLGNQHLRHALFLPALVASQRDPHLGAFYQSLLTRGVAKKPAVVAVARKLLHAIYGMFKSDSLYDGAKLFAGPVLPSGPRSLAPVSNAT